MPFRAQLFWSVQARVGDPGSDRGAEDFAMSRMVEPLTSGRSEPPGEPSRRSEPPDSDFRRDQNQLPQHLGSDGTVKGRRQALRKALKANEAIWVAMEQKANEAFG